MKKLTYLGEIMVERIIDAKLCGTREKAIDLICNEWNSDPVQDVLLGYANSRKK